MKQPKKMSKAAIVLSMLLLLTTCGTDRYQTVASKTESSVAWDATSTELPEPEEEFKQSNAQAPVFDMLPFTYEHSIQKAIYTYRWVGDKDMLDNKQYGGFAPYYYMVQLLDIDLDGELEILLFGRDRAMIGTTVCLVLKIQGEVLEPMGSFDSSTAIQGYNDLTEKGNTKYYKTLEGQFVVRDWRLTRMGKSNALIEVSLEDISSRPIVTFTKPGWEEEFREYFYFDSENFTYQPGGVYPRSRLEPDGYIEISQVDFQLRVDQYLDSLTYAGELEPINVIEYPINARYCDEKYFGFENIDTYNPPEQYIEMEEYELYTEGINTYVAKKIYEAYMQNT